MIVLVTAVQYYIGNQRIPDPYLCSKNVNAISRPSDLYIGHINLIYSLAVYTAFAYRVPRTVHP